MCVRKTWDVGKCDAGYLSVGVIFVKICGLRMYNHDHKNGIEIILKACIWRDFMSFSVEECSSKDQNVDVFILFYFPRGHHRALEAMQAVWMSLALNQP